MAEQKTVARPYAEAAFNYCLSVADSHSALECWSNILSFLVQLLENKEVNSCLDNPSLSNDNKFDLMMDLTQRQLNDEQQRFLHLLIENQRLEVLPEIFQMYTELKNRFDGIKEATISTAFELSDTEISRIQQELETAYQCKISPNVIVAPELIGGVSIRVGEDVIDASIKGKLTHMSAALMN